jgi:hypothetical protein
MSSAKGLPSCESCKLRRVKCIRAESGVCSQCERKGLPCTLPVKQPRKPYKARTGARMEAVKEMYGTGSSVSMALSLQSPETRVVQSEEFDSFLAGLVDAYFQSVSFATVRGTFVRK